MPEANVSKVGHGPKMGQNEFELHMFFYDFHLYSSSVQVIQENVSSSI